MSFEVRRRETSMTMTVSGDISDYHDLLNEKLQKLVEMIARTR